MFAKRQIFLLSALVSTLCLGSLTQAFAQSRTDNLIDGWAVDGAIDGQDRVYSQLETGNSTVLLIEKKSPYQADKFLQVFRHFSATALRGKRIRMTRDIETTVIDAGVPTAGMPRPVVITRVQCNWPGTDMRSISLSFHQVGDDGARKQGSSEFVVPSEARECTLGFATAFPLRVAVRNIKYEEVNVIPSEITKVFPLPESSADLPALEISLPAAAK